MDIKIPQEIDIILNKLSSNGYEAFIVGGSVRDALLSLPIKDFDITTSARPDEIINIFNDYKVIKTGLKHGTVTIIINQLPVEVTTYRIDGIYSDNRHPDQVTFTSSLKDDLSRRDFTLNAIAYSPQSGLIDYFSGITDLRNKTIRAIGDPDKRFSEDALRILRALRFSSQLSFNIEEITSKSILKNKELLNNIARERISAEFIKLICGKNFCPVIQNFYEVVGQFIPEILPMVGFNQNTPYHIYDVFEHTIRSVDAIDPIPVLRLAMLFHDIGKPRCYTEDEYNIGHFKGHSAISAEISKSSLSNLKFDNATIESVYTLVKYHDLKIPNEKKVVKRWLNKLSYKTFMDLIAIKKSDNLAKSPDFLNRLEEIKKYEELANEIISENECFSLKQLAVNGHDLIDAGVHEGKEVGAVLNFLLNAVVDENCKNTKEDLLNYLLCHPLCI